MLHACRKSWIMSRGSPSLPMCTPQGPPAPGLALSSFLRVSGTYPQKAIDVNTVPIKIQMGCVCLCVETQKVILKFVWKRTRPRIAKTVFIKNKSRGPPLLISRPLKPQ